MSAPARELRLIAFRVGPETFLLDIMAVRQIIPRAGLTTVPTAPRFVAGVIVMRGEVIPVIDLRSRLYPALADQAEQPLILVTRTASGVIGLQVDEVRRIVTITSGELLAPPPIVRGIRGELLIAMVTVKEEVFLLIDLENVLTENEQHALQSSEWSSPESAAASER